MTHRTAKCATWPLIVVALSSIAPAASAEDLFIPYPAYGAHRGKIVYRDGPFGSRQKVRWGNGLTAYGAQVLTHGIDALPGILPLFLKDESVPAEKAGPVTVELPAHYTTELNRANQLLERSARLLGHEIAAPAEPTPLTPSNGHESYRNSPDPWNGAGSPGGAAPVPMPPPPAPAVGDAIRNSPDPWNN